mmetsp:Transcript_115862/g.201593  ORF Transcript_115862/g.201593 Transcript_115862/m.201593 type:complete len:190 (-) Transcript_115862:932-1501(-)
MSKAGAGKKGAGNPADKKALEALEGEKQARIDENRARCVALERFLVIRAEQTQRSNLEQETLRRRIIELEHKFTEEQSKTDLTHGEMYRQYKAMQGELIHRIELLQTTINTLRDELEQSRLELEKTKSEKDAVIAERNKKINEQKQKMEDMAIEFGEMLKETLEQMSKRIDTGSSKSDVKGLLGSAKKG